MPIIIKAKQRLILSDRSCFAFARTAIYNLQEQQIPSLKKSKAGYLSMKSSLINILCHFPDFITYTNYFFLFLHREVVLTIVKGLTRSPNEVYIELKKQ